MEYIFIGIILMIIIYIVICATYGRSNANKQMKDINNQFIQDGMIEIFGLIHLGGYPYFKANEKIFIEIRKDNNLYFYKNRNEIINKISINQITRYEIKSESEIQKDVTLTRLFALGILAFGLKKKTEINNSYILLSYEQNDVQIDCLFKNYYNGQPLGNFISLFNKLKIENRGECVL